MEPWIQTYSGKKVYPLGMTTGMVCIEDIAHALAFKCRFGGHCRRFYSVAEHSVRVSMIVRPELAMAALLHDAAEAYLPDFLAPIKSLAYFKTDPTHGDFGVLGTGENCVPPSGEFVVQADQLSKQIHTGLYDASAVERRVMKAIYGAFDVVKFSDKSIKQADLILLATEARDLLGPPPDPWSLDVPLLADVILPWSCEFAENEFLARFERLSKPAIAAA